MLNRRDSLKLSGAAALALLAGEGSAASADEVTGKKIKVAGYGYDRIQAIKDGTVGIDQAEVSFQNENIYSMKGSHNKYIALWTGAHQKCSKMSV